MKSTSAADAITRRSQYSNASARPLASADATITWRFRPVIAAIKAAATALAILGGFSGASMLAFDAAPEFSVLDFLSDAQKAGIRSNRTSFDVAPALAKAVAEGNRRLKLPCGVYPVGAAWLVPSNTEISGSGSCTVILMKSGMSANPQLAFIANANRGIVNNKTLISNADFRNGNSRIYIHDLTMSLGSVTDDAVVWAAYFYKQDGIRFERVHVVGSASIGQSGGFGALNSSNIHVSSDHFENLSGGGACVALWDGSSDYVIDRNYCDGSHRLNFGIQINGVSSDGNSPATTVRGKISANTVRNTRVVGLDVDGLCGSVCGLVEGVRVSHNIIDGVSQYYGMRIGHAKDVFAGDNLIMNVALSGVFIGSGPITTPATQNVTLIENKVANVSQRGGGSAAITVGNGNDHPSHVTLTKNQVLGSSHSYAIRVFPGVAGARIYRGPMMPGVAGVIRDDGAGTNEDARPRP